MGEELDYMSDEFVRNCGENANDIRPGLLKTHEELRKHNLLKKTKSNLENQKKSAEVVLQESLKQPISAMNKGFSMLEKMGFKSGMGLGKNNSGIKEPIGIHIKNDKMGLGHKAFSQSKRAKACENKLENINENEFRALQSKKTRERMILVDFRKSQRICKELDVKCERSEPKESWFWPEEEEEEEDSKFSDDEEEVEEEDSEKVKLSYAEKLEMLTKYLRENYFYCIWCKIQYEDEKDLVECPGTTRDDH